MLGLTVHNFVSAATGLAMAFALVRGFARTESPTVGNFWVDLTRTTLYILLPLSLLLVARSGRARRSADAGGSIEATTFEGAKQIISIGPVASQEAIKELGTNGGGFFNANAAHPFENPERLHQYAGDLGSCSSFHSRLFFAFGRACVATSGKDGRLLIAMGIVPRHRRRWSPIGPKRTAIRC